MNTKYQAIVIGSGATGGVAAYTLAKSGIKVIVIEAGPKLNEKEIIGSQPTNIIKRLIGILKAEKRIQSQHPGYWKSNPSLYVNEKENPYQVPKNRPFIWTQGRQVGGRSHTWGGITLRLSESDLNASEKDGFGQSWPIDYSDLEPHYDALEKLLKVHGARDDLDQLPDGIYLDPLPFTTSEKSFAQKVKSTLKYPVIHSRGFEEHIGNEFPRYSSQGSTLKLALETGNVDLITSHIAEKLIINQTQDKAEGVILIDTVSGRRKKIYSNLIVLTASTIQTLKILLNSQDPFTYNGLIDPSGILGSKLMDHISTSRFFSFPKTNKKSKIINPPKLSGAGSFFIPFGNKIQNSDAKKFIRGYGIWGAIGRFEPPDFLKKDSNSSLGFLIGHGEVLPYKDNKVSLTQEVDKWGIPIPLINFKWNTNEIEMVKHMNKTIEQCIEVSGGKVCSIENLLKVPFIRLISRKSMAMKEETPPPGYYIHEVGGAPMGTSKENSVLDKWNRLWNCQNVLVVDGACWTTSSWQSPTLTMMAIARRACLKAINHLRD